MTKEDSESGRGASVGVGLLEPQGLGCELGLLRTITTINLFALGEQRPYLFVSCCS